MEYKTKLKIGFTILFVVGVGLCVGGIFLAPLMIPGGVFLAGSLAMFQSIFSSQRAQQASSQDASSQSSESPRMIPVTEHPAFTPVLQHNTVNMLYQFNLEMPETIERPQAPELPTEVQLNRLTIV